MTSETLTNTEAIQLYTEIGNYERHFNNVQSIYRGMASSWLLAAFGAIGFILFSKDTPHGLSLDLLIAYIALFCGIGLLLLWNLDINVYHRLLISCFDAGCRFEENCQNMISLPKIRSNMLNDNEYINRGLRHFYLLAIFCQILIATCFIYRAGQATPCSIELFAAGSLLLFVMFACAYMNKTTKQIAPRPLQP